MNDPLAALRLAAAALSQHPDPGVRDIGDWLALGARGDVGEWLGTQNSVGRPWRRYIGTKERDRVLREAARQFFRNIPRTEQARRLAKGLADYHDTEWRQTCLELGSRPHPPGSLRAFYLDALLARAVPVSVRQMERILTDSD